MSYKYNVHTENSIPHDSYYAQFNQSCAVVCFIDLYFNMYGYLSTCSSVACARHMLHLLATCSMPPEYLQSCTSPVAIEPLARLRRPHPLNCLIGPAALHKLDE